MTTTIGAEDPDALNAAASAALAVAEAEPEPEVDTSGETLPETSVHLAGGYLDPNTFNIEYDVEVRELNGADEEAISRSKDIGRALQTILERGTVTVGGEKSTRTVLDMMLMGDRDQVLLSIRRATYGDGQDLHVTCNACDAEQKIEISLSTDVEIRALDAPEDRNFTVTGRVGEIEVSLPDGKTQRELLNAMLEKSASEMNSILLGGCIQAINGTPSAGVKTALSLGIRDRELLSEEIAKRNPGPRLSEVKKNCPNCGEEMTLALSMAALFRL